MTEIQSYKYHSEREQGIINYCFFCKAETRSHKQNHPVIGIKEEDGILIQHN